ncbi:MAG: hypothetical protein LBU27_03930 [Candidatus Peribacteria bacterium]|jgi:hypothetical protein|nr:hypothetical protein [Candidatus Peribacteria bacterium]
MRLQSIETRNTYTDELKKRGIKDKEYGVLTNIGYARTGMDAKQLKTYKGLGKHHNIRDNMTSTEILLTQLQEDTSKNLMVDKNVAGFNEIIQCVEKGAQVAQKTKAVIEDITGKPVISNQNSLTEKQKKRLPS